VHHHHGQAALRKQGVKRVLDAAAGEGGAVLPLDRRVPPSQRPTPVKAPPIDVI
jgi:hypothetical protein